MMMLKNRRLWVAGWSTQLFLLAMAAEALWFGYADQGVTFAVGSSVIGVIRQIERARRAPGS